MPRPEPAASEGTPPPEDATTTRPEAAEKPAAAETEKVHLRITTPFLDNFQVQVGEKTYTVTSAGEDFDPDVAEVIREAARGNKEVSLSTTQAKES